MSLQGNVAVQGAMEELQAKVKELKSQYAEPANVLAELEKEIEAIRKTAESGWY